MIAAAASAAHITDEVVQTLLQVHLFLDILIKSQLCENLARNFIAAWDATDVNLTGSIPDGLGVKRAYETQVLRGKVA
jgi:hypothetical protein